MDTLVYMDTFFSPLLCGYRKGFNAQYALLSVLEKWRISLDNKGYGWGWGGGVHYLWISQKLLTLYIRIFSLHMVLIIAH